MKQVEISAYHYTKKSTRIDHLQGEDYHGGSPHLAVHDRFSIRWVYMEINKLNFLNAIETTLCFDVGAIVSVSEGIGFYQTYQHHDKPPRGTSCVMRNVEKKDFEEIEIHFENFLETADSLFKTEEMLRNIWLEEENFDEAAYEAWTLV
ncbi:hypothetical protein ACJJTC_003263 [Scirpophaga incertulas]